MRTERLTAYLEGARVGWFLRTAGQTSFEHDPDWVPSTQGIEVSASLPRSRTRHTGEAPWNFLWGLLPDNEAILRRWAVRFGARAGNPFSLLEHVGLDCAGAIQLSAVDEPALELDGGVDRISDEHIAQHLDSLERGSSDWAVESAHEGQFSLAGAQAKFAVRWCGDGWGIAWGSEPSTHIVKPGVVGLAQQHVNEHLCMDAGRRLGLDMACSRVESFGDRSAIVVERFDRRSRHGRILRVHQEDFCQAPGLHPAGKYQADGGPGIARSAQLLREVVRGRVGREAVRRFLLACAYNWLIAGTDAHAKNFALLYDGKPTLAPFFDAASSLPYDELPRRKTKLAMSVAGRYRVHEVDADHWARACAELGVDASWFLENLREMNARLPEAFAEAAAGMGADRDEFCDRLVDAVAQRSRSLESDLEATLARYGRRR